MASEAGPDAPEGGRDPAEEQRLKAAVHFTVGQLLEELGEDLGVTFSRNLVAALAQVTFKQMGTVAADLQAFARHAKRATVNPDDVKLLARRKADLYDSICRLADDMEEEGTALRAENKAKRARAAHK